MGFDCSIAARDLVLLCKRYSRGASGEEYESALRALVEQRCPGGVERGVDKVYHWALLDAGMEYRAGLTVAAGPASGVVRFPDTTLLPEAYRGRSLPLAFREWRWYVEGPGWTMEADGLGGTMNAPAREEAERQLDLGWKDASWVTLPEPGRVARAVRRHAEELRRRVGVWEEARVLEAVGGPNEGGVL